MLTLDCLYFQYAYSAFVRQLLQRRKMPVKRNYYEKEDVSARACASVVRACGAVCRATNPFVHLYVVD